MLNKEDLKKIGFYLTMLKDSFISSEIEAYREMQELFAMSEEDFQEETENRFREYESNGFNHVDLEKLNHDCRDFVRSIEELEKKVHLALLELGGE